MILSGYVRSWLEDAKGPRLKEASDYIKFLEAEIKRLNPSGSLGEVREITEGPLKGYTWRDA